MPRYTRRNRGGFKLLGYEFGTKKQQAARKKKLEDEAKRAMEEADRVRKAEKLAKQLQRKKSFRENVRNGALGVTALVGLIVGLSKGGYINIDSSVASVQKLLTKVMGNKRAASFDKYGNHEDTFIGPRRNTKLRQSYAEKKKKQEKKEAQIADAFSELPQSIAMDRDASSIARANTKKAERAKRKMEAKKTKKAKALLKKRKDAAMFPFLVR